MDIHGDFTYCIRTFIFSKCRKHWDFTLCPSWTITFTSCSFAKKVDQRGMSFSHFFIQTQNILVSQDHLWIEQVSLDTKRGNFYFFPLVALRYRHVRKSNFDAELKMLFLRAIFCIPVRMKFQTTFLGRYITTNFISSHVACTTLLLASIHAKNENDVLHVWQINQCFRMCHVCQPISCTL